MKTLAFFAVFAFFGILVYQRVRAIPSYTTFSDVFTVTAPTPTPFPFVEMTIPYLRTRQYVSSLGPRTIAYEKTTYTAYMTSFDSDGFKVNGLLTIPTSTPGSTRFPAIVFVHGFIPPSTYETQKNYYDYVDYLSRNGFVVFKIDLRGHGNSQGEAGGGYFSSDYIIDLLHARAALAASDFVNPKGIGLWGHSMAGNVLLRAFAARPEIPAVAIWAGAVYTYADQQEFGINDNSYRPPTDNTARQRRRGELRAAHGDFSPESLFWSQVAATNYLTDLRGAIEIHHAVDDTVVDIGYSRNLMKLLDRTSIPHQLFEYPSGGHNISGTSFTQAMNRTVEFFRTYLE